MLVREMSNNVAMEEAMECRFIELMEADGYEYWWECEERWDDYEAELKVEGYDEEMVESLFEEMAWDI